MWHVKLLYIIDVSFVYHYFCQGSKTETLDSNSGQVLVTPTLKPAESTFVIGGIDKVYQDPLHLY